MARRIWKDRVVEKPRTFNVQNNADGTITLVPAPGQIVEPGTPVNATNLNGLEDDLESHLAENMPHTFTDGTKTYRYGLSVIDGILTMNYEEVL